MTTNIAWERDGFLLRSARIEDSEPYYEQNYNPLDRELIRMTGCKESFTKVEVTSFFSKSIDAADRYLFLIISGDSIIGECVVSEIDPVLRSAHFRIAILQNAYRGRGIGTWAVQSICSFVFDELKMHRLELNVFSYNTQAQRVYEKSGFKTEGIRRDAIMFNGKYADDILMAMLEDEWNLIN
ncbi:MAG TPA: GNAT family protein [Desulfovibrio sp.]|uniref:GNAT family N-acetyltransferase n=1 Tax=Desulfovibrio sp. TaxID=885 RepID=UPI002D394426|nr:GNAT family protein [Desulfovibrio sp.]HZF62269.1 GNAT family protein [Desulfovibrio sp.]